MPLSFREKKKKKDNGGLGAVWGIGNWVRLKLGFQKFVAENCV
jgi:hypothetical protein